MKFKCFLHRDYLMLEHEGGETRLQIIYLLKLILMLCYLFATGLDCNLELIAY